MYPCHVKLCRYSLGRRCARSAVDGRKKLLCLIEL